MDDRAASWPSDSSDTITELSERLRSVVRQMDPSLGRSSALLVYRCAPVWRANRAGVIVSAFSDRSIPNLSSIVLLVEHEGHTALLTGDARGDRILAGLQTGGLLTDHEPLHVDLLKLPHHGSNRNVERDFFERIHADHYVISADGAFTVHVANEIDFAATTLEDLRKGRSFTVAVRPAKERALVINLDA